MPHKATQIQTQTQRQVQTLSPQQMLVVKLLELPVQEMEERVRGELLENPALEEGTEQPQTEGEAEQPTPEEEGMDYDSLADYLTPDDIPEYKLKERKQTDGERMEEIPFSVAESFYETLQQQLLESDADPARRQLMEYLIGSLDADGLLRKPLNTILNDLAIYEGVEATPEELQTALKKLQELDPPGIAATGLQECLLLQLDRKLKEQQTPAPALLTAKRILTQCYEAFTRKHWDKIAKRLGEPAEKIEEALAEIVRLNPKPGAALGESVGKSYQQIVPDFVVETGDDGEIEVSLNSRGVPPLMVSRRFSEMLEEQLSGKNKPSREVKEAMLFLKQKVDAAKGFISAVQQRQITLLTTMKAIVRRQRAFFLEGEESALNPLILKDIAEDTGYDISTISRVSNSKYVQTNFGIYPLKFFFVDGYVTDDGEELSVREIKEALQNMVAGEDKQHPLTDDRLAEMLKEKGYPIARRTVAKYRTMLHIPVARLRK